MSFISLVILILTALYNNSFNGDPEPQQLAEKAYLHIDRRLYNAGDDIWFKAYVIDPSTNNLSVNTNNLHVELISPASEIIQSRTVRIEEGTGKGDFRVPVSVQSGNYRIRAYTNSMRNFDDRLFFLAEIIIINPIDEGRKPENNIQYVDDKIDMSFFPEGGSLVDDVSSNVAFKAVNSLGKGCNVTGDVFSSEGDVITTFKSSHLGMGFFTLKPESGVSYYAILKTQDGIPLKAGLPRSYPTGITMSVLVTIDKKLLLTVSTNTETLIPLQGRDLTLSFSLPNMVTRIIEIKVKSLINNFLLPGDEFPDGVIKVTLSGTEGLPLCERLVFLQKNSATQLNVTTDKKEYLPREKVSVSISLSGGSSYITTGNFSLSAAEAGFTDISSPNPTSIASWFLLESDVHGPVEEPSYYFDPLNKNRLADLDILLMTQGWRDFQWKYDSILPFIHEIGFMLTGRVTRILNKNPIEGTKINLGIFTDRNSIFLSTNTDPYGYFSFEGLDITGRADMFISATGKNERMEGRIFIDSVLYDPPPPGELTAILPKLILRPDEYSTMRQDAEIRLAIRKKYKLSDTIDIGEVLITAERPDTEQEEKVKESRRVYGTPDKEMIVSPPMENFAGDVFDLIQGRIPGVKVERDPLKRNAVTVYIRNQKSIGDTEATGALILIDGRLMDGPDDINYVLALPAYMVDRIDVINASPLYGQKGANGSINIITRSGMRRVPGKPSLNTASVKFKGFDIPRIFNSPKHNNPKDPDYSSDMRSTIFWEPEIKIEKNENEMVEFYNADNSTTINILVEGVTSEGIPVTGRTKYSVK